MPSGAGLGLVLSHRRDSLLPKRSGLRGKILVAARSVPQEFPQLLNISRLSDETTFEVGKLACCQLRHSAAVTHLAECHASVTLEAVPAQVGLLETFAAHGIHGIPEDRKIASTCPISMSMLDAADIANRSARGARCCIIPAYGPRHLPALLCQGADFTIRLSFPVLWAAPFRWACGGAFGLAWRRRKQSQRRLQQSA